ncbi:MAG: glycoside hydrolase family 29, partial [Cyclobacteriaceae bacterium]|nr:glycoside hydrolase family 29 [Cyclobacteriaceae bacterium]
DVLPIIQQYQPNCLYYHNSQLAEARWGGSESGTVPYPCWATFPNHYSHAGDTQEEHIKLLKHGDTDGKYWMPAMSDAPLRGINGRHEWFWEPGDKDNIYPLNGLMDMYYKSVGRNSTLILGLTPDPQGLMPQGDVARLKEFGDEIKRRFSQPVATTSGTGSKLVLKLEKKQHINHVILREDIKFGERVRLYKIEALVDGRWQTVGDGESIGNKRIQQFDAVHTNKLRLTVGKSIAPPLIKSFSAFLIENP